MKFHSPYQFIPIKASINKTNYNTLAELKDATNAYVRHDFWTKEGLSGRINCTLKTISPLVVGAKQEAGTQAEAGKVHPYCHKNKSPAIPANSLRGMIASLVETLSHSSLRVLDSEQNSSYTINKKPVPGNLYQALQRMADKDTLPWNKNRQQLTPAECMFGVIEDEPNEAQPARNLASRIQFTDAVAKADPAIKVSDEIILKILDSPKPPSPAMYFHAKTKGGHISKTALDLTKHNPNGRKHYLPQPKTEFQGKKVWQSKFTKNNPPKSEDGKVNWKQYLRCTPIAENSEFTFSIHFENLSPAELGLLQTALQPNVENQSFTHRLGLGKPLGLGQITLTMDTTETINRPARYSLKNLDQNRYQPYTQRPETSLVDKDTLAILTTLYNPANIDDPDNPANINAPVCYPFNSENNQQPYNEGEGFLWFVENDKPGNPKKQKLALIKANQKIPKLDSF